MQVSAFRLASWSFQFGCIFWDAVGVTCFGKLQQHLWILRYSPIATTPAAIMHMPLTTRTYQDHCVWVSLEPNRLHLPPLRGHQLLDARGGSGRSALLRRGRLRPLGLHRPDAEQRRTATSVADSAGWGEAKLGCLGVPQAPELIRQANLDLSLNSRQEAVSLNVGVWF